MPTPFQARPLGVLDRLYRFVGGLRGTSYVELDTAIQLVHDVSRNTELGGTGMGFFIAGSDTVHVGASTIEATFDPYDEAGTIFPAVPDKWVWLMTPWVTAIGNITSVSLAMNYVPYQQSIVRRDRLLEYWTSTTAIDIADQGVAPATHSLAGTPSNFFPGPTPVPPGSVLGIRAISSAATTIRTEGLFWTGPEGSTPPGVA